jgi:hypothetical protein
VQNLKCTFSNAGKGRGSLATVGGNVSHYRHQYGASSKTKIRSTYDPAILLLGKHPKESKPTYNRNAMFIAALLTRDKLLNQPKCPSTDE